MFIRTLQLKSNYNITVRHFILWEKMGTAHFYRNFSCIMSLLIFALYRKNILL